MNLGYAYKFVAFAAALASDPAVQAGVLAVWIKFKEFIDNLPEREKLAYLSQFEPLGAIGQPCCPDEHCPECPDDCKCCEEELIKLLAA